MLVNALRLARLLRDGQELGATFQRFESERRPRAERIVAAARRNGNQKGYFSATGAWLRNQMFKMLIPFAAKGQSWMYSYDPRAA